MTKPVKHSSSAASDVGIKSPAGLSNPASMPVCAATERLRFRHLRLSDAPLLRRLYADPTVMARTLFEPLTADQALQRLQRMLAAYRQGGACMLGIVLKNSGELIGYCGLERSRVAGQHLVEFEQMLLPRYWGQGYASEAAQAVLDQQQRQLQLQKIYALVDPGHEASIRVLQKVGMRRIKDSSYGGKPVAIFLRGH